MLEISEIIIPVPWGHIAAKTWGSSNNCPILMIHGRQDNAGSFDLLIPKLSENNYYICIDLPSHGKSSHFPPRIFIQASFFVLAVKYVIDYFKWKKITIIAHSLGARTASYLALVYPHLIDRLVFLDAISIYPVHPSNFSNMTQNFFQDFIKINKKLENNNPPEYTMEECLTRVMEKRPTTICKEGALNMLNRALIPCQNGKFQFSMDQRLKCIFFDVMSNHNIASIIKCAEPKYPQLILTASETNNVMFNKSSEPLLKELKSNPNFKIIIVNGNHDVHNNNPDLVARYINIFLEKFPPLEFNKKSKL